MSERKNFSRTMASVLKGASSLFALGTKQRPLLEKSDAEAIGSDWKKVGDDIRRASEKFADENIIKKES